MAVTADGSRVYVNLWGLDEVAVIDTATNTVLTTVAVGDGPRSIGRFIGPAVSSNTAPTADAGPDQAIRAGDMVYLNGGASFDDNTPSGDLLYDWSFSYLPSGSEASLADADTATPSFLADIADTYVVQLVVTDEAGLASEPDEVVISATTWPRRRPRATTSWSSSARASCLTAGRWIPRWTP